MSIDLFANLRQPFGMNEISSIPLEFVAQNILVVRGQKVMLDYTLADIYGVPTKSFNQTVSRNAERFPEDFMFRLTPEEVEELNRSQIVTGSQKHRDPRFPPRAFTQEGVAMLSGILRSARAVEVNIAIMRTFVRMREVLATHKDVARKIEEHDQHIAALYDYVRQIMAQEERPKNPIGYVKPNDK